MKEPVSSYYIQTTTTSFSTRQWQYLERCSNDPDVGSPVWMILCSSNKEFELAPFAGYNINVHDFLACTPTYRISCAQLFSSLPSTGIFPAPDNQAGNHPRRFRYSIQSRAPNANPPFRPLWHMPRPIRLSPLEFHTVAMERRLNRPQQLNLVARP